MQLFIVMTLFLTTAALACPDLEGIYASCKSVNQNKFERKDLQIKQVQKGKSTIFKLSEIDPESELVMDSEIVANGRVESEVDPINDVVIRTITYCRNDELVLDSKYLYKGQRIGSMETVSSKVGDRLVIVAKGEVENKAYQDSIICE